MIKLKSLINEIEFATQKAFDTYAKNHKLRPDTKVKIAGKTTTAGAASKPKGTSVFSKDYKGEDPMATVNAISSKTGLRAQAVAGWADENGVNLSKVADDINSKKLNPMDFMTAVSGKAGNKYAKDIISKYSQGGEDKTKKEPKSTAPKREGNPEVNQKVVDAALDLGITPMEWATSAYEEKIAQAAVEALTDSNFHSEARELIAKLEGKPEWAKDPRDDAPEYGTPEYKKWRNNSVYSSKYYDGDVKGNNAGKLGRVASEEAGWDGVAALDAIAAHARKMGSDKLADTLQSIFDDKPYMKNESMKLSSMIKNK